MTRRTKRENRGTMLDLWRPPRGAGEPVGCLATTFTFMPGLFDEQCLARFLEIESDPDREDLSFLLERESRLGRIYAGVLVDFTQAGVEHSLRWDVLPVRIPRGKQHAKLTLLAWSGHIRLLVASANITDPGYRSNFEVASAVEFQPDDCDRALLESATAFLASLLEFVPTVTRKPPEIIRSRSFLDNVNRLAADWKDLPRSRRVRQTLACTLPARTSAREPRSTLDELVAACRRRGATPSTAWVASPFFDADPNTNAAAEQLCKRLSRDGRRVRLCVPGSRPDESRGTPRLAAPKSLLASCKRLNADVRIEILPDKENKERRPWHAKMMSLFNEHEYAALMIGSSNFTAAGLGISTGRNAEANLVTVVDKHDKYAREAGLLEAVWPDTDPVTDPTAAEWTGVMPDEDAAAAGLPLPEGFLGATYRAGDHRELVIHLDPGTVPAEWWILAPAFGPTAAPTQSDAVLLASDAWKATGSPAPAVIRWDPPEPPARLLVRWDGGEAFMPVNVEDQRSLPAPAALAEMTAEAMLEILAASDPAAAIRIWARQRSRSETGFDEDHDSAVDLDPLRRHDLSSTFLHRVRRRAHTMGQLRRFVERPAPSRQAIDSRLTGLIGIEPLALKMAAEFESACHPGRQAGNPGESLLTLADLLLVLAEARYRPIDGAVPLREFNAAYRPFLRRLSATLDTIVRRLSEHVPDDACGFWRRVVEQCSA